MIRLLIFILKFLGVGPSPKTREDARRMLIGSIVLGLTDLSPRDRLLAFEGYCKFCGSDTKSKPCLCIGDD